MGSQNQGSAQRRVSDRERGETLGIGKGGKHTISRILKEELVVVDEDRISRQEDEREWVGNKVEEKRREEGKEDQELSGEGELLCGSQQGPIGAGHGTTPRRFRELAGD